MNKRYIIHALNAAVALIGIHSASAHISYSGRDFGIFQADGSDAPVTINGQLISSQFGWASGTDANLGDSHRLRAFRFTLAQAGTVTLSLVGAAGLHPAFSIYDGLAHVAPNALDHDFSNISQAYLTSLGIVPNDGSFNALGDWKIGNDTSVPDGLGNYNFSELSSFTYEGNAADGTSANYGAAAGINGDGNADGSVAGTFTLPAGTYSIFVGGDDLATQSPTYTNYGITATLSVVPEPSSILLIGLSCIGLLARRHRS